MAQDLGVPLLALHIFSPGDYKAHDRGPRRIDFQLRQLAYLKGEFAKHHIPFFTITHKKRKDIPRMLCEKLKEWGAIGLFANIEYEVDELRRDIEVLERTKKARESGDGFAGQVEFFKDYCVVSPGELLTKVGPHEDTRRALLQDVPNLILNRLHPPARSKENPTRSTVHGSATGPNMSTRTCKITSRSRTGLSSPTAIRPSRTRS